MRTEDSDRVIMLEFTKIKSMSLWSEEVYHQILNAVMTRTITPQQRIVQTLLADQMNVSRTPVRDALIRLENEGVLVRDGRSGYKIRRYSEQEILQIYQSREAVESFAIGLLTRQKNDRVIQRIERIVDEMESIPKNSITEYYDANRTIHRAFVYETSNSFLLELFDAIWNRSSSYILFSELGSDKFDKTLTGHTELCDALRSGDEQYAVDCMRKHIREGSRLHNYAEAPAEQIFDLNQINRKDHQ